MRSAARSSEPDGTLVLLMELSSMFQLRIYPEMIFGQNHKVMTRWASILIAGSMWVAGGNRRATEVGLIKINGAIGPATAGYISRAIDVAATRHDTCLIIQLDTPGGLLGSTKDIV